MRVVVCDYSGHPFQVQLARELASRKHDVQHIHFAEFQTPKGQLKRLPTDPPNLDLQAVSLGRPFAKYVWIKRWLQEREVGRLIVKKIVAFAPDVVIASNVPLDGLSIVADYCFREGIPLIFWQQDIYSIAIQEILSRKLSILGSLIGAYYKRIERRVLNRSACVIVISADFLDVLDKYFGVKGKKLHVIENWAPIDEIKPFEKVNQWSRQQRLDQVELVLYTGTLGLKHDPAQIIAVAQKLKRRARTKILVISEGPGADWLAAQAQLSELSNLSVMPFQSYGVYPDVLGSADVLLAILEPTCGVFSVPSKVLSYLCAGRPIVLAAPTENLASKIVERSGGGLSIPAGDGDRLGNAILQLLDDPERRKQMARDARSFAEKTFNIKDIGDKFEAVLKSASLR